MLSSESQLSPSSLWLDLQHTDHAARLQCLDLCEEKAGDECSNAVRVFLSYALLGTEKLQMQSSLSK